MADAQTFQIKATVLKGLAHPLRLRVLELLQRGEQSVGRCAEALAIDQPTASRHLGILRQVGLVSARQEGTSVVYRVQNGETAQLLAQLTRVLKRKLQLDSALSNGVNPDHGLKSLVAPARRSGSGAPGNTPSGSIRLPLLRSSSFGAAAAKLERSRALRTARPGMGRAGEVRGFRGTG